MFSCLKNLTKLVLNKPQTFYLLQSALSTEAFTAKSQTYHKRVFERLDANEDGLITKEDLESGLSRSLEIKPSENQLKRALELLRPGNVGFVSLDDLVQYYVMNKLPREDDFKKEFLIIDKDHDGFVSVNDLRDWYVTIENDSLHRMYDKYLPCEVKMYKSYRNGRINLDEYIEINATLFLLASVFDLPVFRETFP